MYIVIYYHILMGRLHLVHHCKPIHLRIHIKHFEYQEGYNTFVTNGIEMDLLEWKTCKNNPNERIKKTLVTT
jgi:hypothetical protein